VLVAAAALAVVAGSAHATTEARCSGTSIKGPLPAQKLPREVASMRSAIFAAALRCDYTALQRLGDKHGKGVEISFGPEPAPAIFWRQQEARGEPVMRFLAKLLQLPFARSQGFYAWPSAFRLHPTDADWRALRAIYPQRVIDAMKKDGIGYSGYRVGIKPNGDWQFFVTGD
jgi:hypothetical protein